MEPGALLPTSCPPYPYPPLSSRFVPFFQYPSLWLYISLHSLSDTLFSLFHRFVLPQPHLRLPLSCYNQSEEGFWPEISPIHVLQRYCLTVQLLQDIVFSFCQWFCFLFMGTQEEKHLILRQWYWLLSVSGTDLVKGFFQARGAKGLIFIAHIISVPNSFLFQWLIKEIISRSLSGDKGKSIHHESIQILEWQQSEDR